MVFRTVGHAEEVNRYKTFNTRYYTLADLKNAVKQLTNPKVPVSKYKTKSALMGVLVERGAEDLLFNTPQKVFKKEARTKRIPRPEGAAPKYAKKKFIGPSIPREIRSQMASQRKAEKDAIKRERQIQRELKRREKDEEKAKRAIYRARLIAEKMDKTGAKIGKGRQKLGDIYDSRKQLFEKVKNLNQGIIDKYYGPE